MKKKKPRRTSLPPPPQKKKLSAPPPLKKNDSCLNLCYPPEQVIIVADLVELGTNKHYKPGTNCSGEDSKLVQSDNAHL